MGVRSSFLRKVRSTGLFYIVKTIRVNRECPLWRKIRSRGSRSWGLLLYKILCPLALYKILCPLALYKILCPLALYKILCPLALYKILCPLVLYKILCPLALYKILYPLALYKCWIYQSIKILTFFSDDIFADVSPAAPKTKKETKKKTDGALKSAGDSDNIFDDPLLGGK
jgi:hypothetical protein